MTILNNRQPMKQQNSSSLYLDNIGIITNITVLLLHCSISDAENIFTIGIYSLLPWENIGQVNDTSEIKLFNDHIKIDRNLQNQCKIIIIIII